MKGRILGSLFALPFFGVGVWMLWSIGTTLIDAADMRGWQPTPAKLEAAGYTTSSGDDSDTYKAYATYNYNYNGQRFRGDRVNHGWGGDNIGDYQQDTGERLAASMSRGESISVWVNPDNPYESIVDPTVRWGMIGFKSIFLFVFGGVGLGLLIAIWRAPREKDAELPEYQQSPWLLNHDWQTATIRSSSKGTMWGMWAFAGFWSAISSFLPFMIYEEVLEKQNYLALIGLLFPVVGIGLIGWAIKLTREWRRFGASPVTLDPFPGSIGGHVGGTIELNLPYVATNRFLLTLNSLHSYYSGSGKNRSRKERVLWQDEAIAHSEMTSTGTRLSFRFDVPDGQRESDPQKRGDSYHLWRLNLRADIPGTDLNRDFDIPVFATEQRSQNISAHKVDVSQREQDAIYDDAIRKIFNVRRDGVSTTLSYPPGRHLWSNLAGFTVGASFAAAGAYMGFVEGSWLFGVCFGGTGALVAISAFYMLFKSLSVTLDAGTITSVRRVLGIPLRTRTMRRDAFYRFEISSAMQTQAGGKHTMYFSINAIDRSANEIRLGDGFKGKSQAEAAERFLSKEFGLFEKSPAANDSGTGLLSYTTPVSRD
jgi:hypothetical protein